MHRVRGLGSQLVQGLPRRHAAARRDREPLHQEALDDPKGGLVMTDTLQEHADPTLHKGEALVEMKDVGKTYGAIRALRGINLTVNAGEVTCVLGDNGAGKSTLIKIISGLHPHNEGTLKVDGAERALLLTPGVAQPRHRHRLPGPRRGRPDGGVAELLPRLGDDRQQVPAVRTQDQGDEADRR